MAVSSEQSAQPFDGNNSTSTPYVVPFVVHSAADISVEVRALGSPVFTLLGPSEYTVHEVAGGFTVTTTVAHPATTSLTIFRWLPLTQPLILPLAGSLPGPGLERAFDRVVMQIQQYLRVLSNLGTVTIPGVGDGTLSVSGGIASFTRNYITCSFAVSAAASAVIGDGTLSVSGGIASFTLNFVTYSFPVAETGSVISGTGQLSVSGGIASFTLNFVTYSFPVAIN